MICRVLPVLLAALALAGCGVGPGSATSGDVQLHVTRDFGRTQIATATKDGVRESDTVMRFLQSKRRVSTAYGGGFVQSIDGLAGSKTRHVDWFYYVNGREADVGAADYRLAKGDVVQWDYHDWLATMHIPAIVGAFPEPFAHGFKGKRLPTRVECADAASSRACDQVVQRLAAQKVIASRSVVGQQTSGETLRVVVGLWPSVRQVPDVRAIENGPQASGVFARPDPSGRSMALLDEAGTRARTVGAGSGLVAATQGLGNAVVWVVGGVDEAGVQRAAAAIDPSTLRNAFAVAATPAGVERLPLPGGGAG